MRLFFRLFLLVAIVNSNGISFAQPVSDTVRDNRNYRKQSATFSETAKSNNKFHYVGFQANQILRQLVGGAGATDNPYLFAYSFNSIDRGGGMNFGLGFNFTTTDDSDPTINLTRSTKSNSSAIRVGYDKKKSIGKRWIAGFGFDIFRNGGKSETKTTFSGGGTNVNTITTKTNGFGIGPRLSLLFNVNEKIYLGTEAIVYFMFEKTTSKGDPSIPASLEQELKAKSFKLGAPTSLFLMVRF